MLRARETLLSPLTVASQGSYTFEKLQHEVHFSFNTDQLDQKALNNIASISFQQRFLEKPGYPDIK